MQQADIRAAAKALVNRRLEHQLIKGPETVEDTMEIQQADLSNTS
jgi:hypothetical protein